ncbi:unnamed protein product, partial [Iphiclides podalirius]
MRRQTFQPPHYGASRSLIPEDVRLYPEESITNDLRATKPRALNLTYGGVHWSASGGQLAVDTLNAQRRPYANLLTLTYFI